MTACAPEANPPIDLTEITERSSEHDVTVARNLCITCPALVKCRQYVLRTTDVAGMAAGMTERERDAWRDRHGLAVKVVDIIDATPAHQLTPAILSGLPHPDGTSTELHPRVREVVIRMTNAGLTADDIVTRLDRDDVTHRTVNYLRRTYMKGWARVDA